MFHAFSCAEYAGEGLVEADQPATEEYILDTVPRSHSYLDCYWEPNQITIDRFGSTPSNSS
jgi:hypothetical protein